MTMRDLSAPGAFPRSFLPTRKRRRIDTRLIAGITLIALSLGLTSSAMSRAAHTTSLWSAARDLPAGTVLTKSDVTVVQANLASAVQRYRSQSQPVIGMRVARDVTAGEFIATSAITAVKASATRLVTVSVEQFHAPAGLSRGDLVDVYVNPTNDSGMSGTASLIAGRVAVHSVDDDGGTFGTSAGSVGVVLELSRENVARVVSGARTGTVDLVRVPMDQP